MDIVVINGSTRHGSTWHCKELLLNSITSQQETQVTEFTLPKDMPHFCKGCFSCFFKGEDSCPHASNIGPIVEALENSDIIVMTSSVYALDITGQLKALLDHLCFMWMSHRPNPKMFNKVAVTIATTAGAGLGHTTKTMRNSFKYWCVKRTFSLKCAVSASKWDEVTDKRRQKLETKISSTAKQVVKAVNKANKIRTPFTTRLLFLLMRAMMKKNTWNPKDRNHWLSNGWLDGSMPF